MSLIFSKFSILVSPIIDIHPEEVSVSSAFHRDTETNSSYGLSAFISRREATRSRYETLSTVVGEEVAENYGFVSVNDTSRTMDINIGLTEETFDGLMSALSAFGPLSCVVEAEFTLTAFATTFRGYREALLSCGPRLLVSGTEDSE